MNFLLYLVCILGLALTCSSANCAETNKQDLPFNYNNSAILQPQDCDTFYGKKDRLYLHGMWKILHLGGRKGYDFSDDEKKKSYWSIKFDDSNWQKRPVPEDIYCNNRYKKLGLDTGLIYFRKTFSLPQKFSSKRTILTFRRISRNPIIWINGKEIPRPVNLSPDKISDVYSTDITNYLQKGSNLIAVRLEIGKNYRWVHGNGIWEPCWIEFLPEIYCSKILVAPQLPGSISVRCTIINTKNAASKLNLKAEISPWIGNNNYQFRLKGKSAITTKHLGELALQPGKNDFKFNIEIDKPVLWDIDNPFLYSLKFYNVKGERIGWERFGLREFMVKGPYFYLNGHRIFLYGVTHESWENLLSTLSNRADASNNKNNYLRRYLEMLRNVNINCINRIERIPPQIFLDICDEVGMLQMPTPDVLCEMNYTGHAKNLLKKGKPIFLNEALKRNTADAFNHPSLVAYTPEGESARHPGMLEFASEYKTILEKYDPTRLFSFAQTPSWMGKNKDGKNVLLNPAAPFDFMNHASLIGSHRGATPHTFIPDIVTRDAKERNAKWYDGKQKPQIYTESLSYAGYKTHAIYWPHMLKYYGSVFTNGKLNKSIYCELYGKSAPAKKGWLSFHLYEVGVVGIRNSQDKEKLYSWMAEYDGEMLEMIRMNNDNVQGFGAITGPMFTPGKNGRIGDLNPAYLNDNAYSRTFREKCAPAFVCGDIHWNHNYFAGRSCLFTVHVFNETLEDIVNAEVEVSITGKQRKIMASHRLVFADLNSVSHVMQKLEMTIPGNLESGNYLLSMKLKSGKRKICENSYPIYILGKKDFDKKISTSFKIALIVSGKSHNKSDASLVLKHLGIKFKPVLQARDLSEFDIVVIDRDLPESFDAACIKKYLDNGGKVVCMNQTNTIPGIDGLKVESVDAHYKLKRMFGKEAEIGIRADLIEPEHPLFKGISNARNWRQWNGNHGEIFRNLLFPLSEGVLLSGAINGNYSKGKRRNKKIKFGMLIAEIKIGKGVLLVSQVEALEKYGVDSVATKYLHNLFEYTLGKGWDGSHATELR